MLSDATVRACRRHLSHEDQLFVAVTMMRHSARLSALWNAAVSYVAPRSQRDAAALLLRLAKQVNAGGAA